MRYDKKVTIKISQEELDYLKDKGNISEYMRNLIRLDREKNNKGFSITDKSFTSWFLAEICDAIDEDSSNKEFKRVYEVVEEAQCRILL